MIEQVVYQNKKLLEQLTPSGASIQGTVVGVDTTDHFNIICMKDLIVMPICRVIYYKESKQLYLIAVCPKCGMVAQRKIYLDQTEPKHLWAIVDCGVVFLHNKERVRCYVNKVTEEKFRVEE